MNLEPREINIDLIEFISAWILDDLAVIGVYLLNSNYSPRILGNLIEIIKLAIKNNLSPRSHW